MQQLLSLNGQSELFTSIAGELKVTGADSAGKPESSEFARALFAGMQDSELVSPQAQQAQGFGGLSEPDNNTRFDFDRDRVGAPVEAPILEMLEEMQSLLKPSEGTEEVAMKPAADTEQVTQLTQLLKKLGTEHLTDEQRQQLAAEILAGLSDQEKQLVPRLDTEVLPTIQRQKTPLDGSRQDADTLALPRDETAQLLAKIGKIAALADRAVAVVQDQVVTPKQLGEGASPAPLDEKTLQWLSKQLDQLERQGTQKDSASSGQLGAPDVLIKQLQRQIADTDDLNVEQKQQLRQWLADKGASEANGVTIASLQKAVVNEQSQQSQQSQRIDMLSATETQPRTVEPPRAERPAASPELTQQSWSNKVAEPSKANDKNQPLQPDMFGAQRSVDGQKGETKLAEAGVGEVKSREGQVDKSAIANAVANATDVPAALKPATSLDTTNGLNDHAMSQQASAISTTSGQIKATELSSTLQSSLQAIQKPLDPSQAEASQKLQERINIMLSKNIQRADIRLDPPELGQLHVRVNMNSDQASVQFQVQSTQARDAVEQALPRLREMLEQQGVALADTDVKEQQQQFAGDSDESSSEQRAGNTQPGEVVDEHEIALNNGRPVAPGAVDFYV